MSDAPMRVPHYDMYLDETNKACDLVFAAKKALEAGDVQKWNELIALAGEIQQKALQRYKAAAGDQSTASRGDQPR